MCQGRATITLVVYQVPEQSPGIVILGITPQSTLKPLMGLVQPVQLLQHRTEIGRCLGTVRIGCRREAKKPLRPLEQSLAKQNPAGRQHQVDVLREPELQNAVEGSKRPAAFSQFEQRLPEADQRVLVIGLQA